MTRLAIVPFASLATLVALGCEVPESSLGVSPEGGATTGGATSTGGRATTGGSDRTSTGGHDSSGSGGDPADVCSLPFDAGECDGAFPVYSFDAETKRCVPKIWGGCNGNDNRFQTSSDCYAACAPPECRLATSGQEGPFEVRFDIFGVTAQPFYLREECGRVEHEVYTCADGYSEPLATSVFCMGECGGEPSCPICGPCDEPAGLAEASIPWSGTVYDIESTAVWGCSCYRPGDAPPGRYRVQVPYYATEQAAADHAAPAGTCTVDFELPDPDGVVEVMIGLGSDCTPAG